MSKHNKYSILEWRKWF